MFVLCLEEAAAALADLFALFLRDAAGRDDDDTNLVEAAARGDLDRIKTIIKRHPEQVTSSVQNPYINKQCWPWSGSHCLLHVTLTRIWASSWENVSSGVCDQVRLKPACSDTEESYSLESLDLESTHTILSRQRTTKELIRLRGCASWSAPLLFAYGIRHIFSWPGSFISGRSGLFSN